MALVTELLAAIKGVITKYEKQGKEKWTDEYEVRNKL